MGYHRDSAPRCPIGLETPSSILEYWRSEGAVKAGAKCPCGVFGHDPPFQLLQATENAIAGFKASGGRTVIYSGDLASHNQPGSAAGDKHCGTAKAVLKATVDLLNHKGMNHLFVMGTNDVFPRNQPLSQEWIDDLGSFLVSRSWLRPSELPTWKMGGFFRRQLLPSGLCAVGLNSNLWTISQTNETMKRAQELWLPSALRTDASCNRFMIVSHIAPGKGRGNHATPSKRGRAGDTASSIRHIIDHSGAKIIAEVYGDLNKEYYFLTSPKSFGFTAVGVSRRGGNDPGFHRVVLDETGSKVQDIESYQMKKGCEYSLSFSYVKAYAPYFNDGINADSVRQSLKDRSLDRVRRGNIRPQQAGHTQADLNKPAFLRTVRAGGAGC